MMAAKKDTATKPEVKPQPAAPATQATPAQAVAAQPTKAEQTIAKLKDAWTARNVDLSKMTITADGKNMNVQVADNWPLIVIGPGGGIVLPEIRSYAKAWDAAVDGDNVLRKQNERDQKKATPAAPKDVVVTAKTHVTPEQAKQTPASKKAAAHEQIEQKLQSVGR